MKADLLESAACAVQESSLLLSFAKRWFSDIAPQGKRYSDIEKDIAAFRFYTQQDEMICLLEAVQVKLNDAAEMLNSKTKLGA